MNKENRNTVPQKFSVQVGNVLIFICITKFLVVSGVSIIDF